MGTFVADPITLETKGNEIIGLAELFTTNMNTMYSTINEMTSTDYLSPEAKEMARKIGEYKQDLTNIRNVMANYGSFCVQSSTAVLNNQSDISDDIRGVSA